MKKKFDWEKFINTDEEIVVHCKTNNEAEAFCNLMDKHGLKWSSGESYTEKTRWKIHKTETCYSSEGCYSDKLWYEYAGYKILEFSDYDFTGESEKVLLNADPYKEKIDALVKWLLSPYEPPKKKPVITDVVRRFLEE